MFSARRQNIRTRFKKLGLATVHCPWMASELFERPPTRPPGRDSSPLITTRPPTTVLFNEFEVGRSANQMASKSMPAFRDTTHKATPIEKTQVPVGAYDPYHYDDVNRMYGYSRVRRAFDSTDRRDMSLRIGELGYAAPSPGHYPHEHSAGRRTRTRKGRRSSLDDSGGRSLGQ